MMMRHALADLCEAVGVVITPAIASMVDRLARRALDESQSLDGMTMGDLRQSLTYPVPPYAPRCGACGDILPDGARFCIACGKATAMTGRTERLGDTALYVTQAEYKVLLGDPHTHRFWVGDIFNPDHDELCVYYFGRKVIIRDE